MIIALKLSHPKTLQQVRELLKEEKNLDFLKNSIYVFHALC